jgi:DNA-directed RNA polymerase I subunit RPA2
MAAHDDSLPTRERTKATPKSRTKPAFVDGSIPSFRRGHLPGAEDVERLRFLTRPHVESFNFFLDVGLRDGVRDIEPAELDVVDPKRLQRQQQAQEGGSGSGSGGGTGTGNGGSIDWEEVPTVRFWVEDVRVNKPIKSSSAAGRNPRMLPRECRERSYTYAGQIVGNFCHQTVRRRNGLAMEGSTVRISKTFGNLPIMVGSKACHLAGMTPSELVKLKEEVRDVDVDVVCVCVCVGGGGLR